MNIGLELLVFRDAALPLMSAGVMTTHGTAALSRGLRMETRLCHLLGEVTVGDVTVGDVMVGDVNYLK